MFKKTINYEDFDGNKRSEDHYFHLSKAEVIKWLTTSGDYTLDKVLERLSTERNGKKIMEIFEDFIQRSYGIKSIDGRKFEKSEEIWKDFSQTEAYSVLFVELVTDAKKAADFVTRVIPKSLADEVEKIIRENPEGVPDNLKDYIPENPRTGVTIVQNG